MSISEKQIPVACPVCSSADPTIHERLSAGGGQLTVRCMECDHVHKVDQPDTGTVTQDVIISQNGESFATTVDISPDERVTEGEEFIVDSEKALMLVRITGIEIGPEQRTTSAPIEQIETLWTRAVDNVTVNVTVNPQDNNGSRDSSRSITLNVPGDHEFVVGETEEFGDETFEVNAIQVRPDAPEYRHGTFDHTGDMVYAKDVKRLYGTDQTTSAWSAW
jgi:uncharacterized Zn finger protein